MQAHTTSRDGTRLAYERIGAGEPVLLVGGGLTDRGENAPLGRALAERFTVLNYDRRGRGRSGDTLPYSVDRELEDLAAIAAIAGGPVHAFGASSGGALLLAAAAAGLPFARLAVYEVPFATDPAMRAHWRDYRRELAALLAADRRDDVLALFMRLAGSSDADLAAARDAPIWRDLRSLAPTLAYDAACLGDQAVPTAQLATITHPTLVLTGGSVPFMESAADAIAAALPHVERRVLDNQGHVADPAALGAALATWFSA